MTASFGVAGLPEQGRTAGDLLGAADTALRDAKERGRNQFRLASVRPGEMSRMAGLWRCREEILEALKSGAFVPYFQPVLNLSSGRLEKNEALARWVSPTGVRAPGEFLPAAEHFGFSSQLDFLILRSSLDRLQAVRKSGRSWGAVAVNLSAQSLDEEGLPDRYLALLEQTGNPPSDLILEITETAAVRSIDRARSFVETLRAHGVRFALDDFGVGYSAFSHLRALPLDYLKFDMSFIRNLVTSEFDRVFVTGMNEMAHGLGHPDHCGRGREIRHLDAARGAGCRLRAGLPDRTARSRSDVRPPGQLGTHPARNAGGRDAEQADSSRPGMMGGRGNRCAVFGDGVHS